MKKSEESWVRTSLDPTLYVDVLILALGQILLKGDNVSLIQALQ